MSQNNNPLNQALDRYIINPIVEKARDRVYKDLQKSHTKQNEIDPRIFNMQTNAKKRKPEGTIKASTLRDFSVHYPIARACIDHLKHNITQLEWDIVPEDKDKEFDRDSVRDIREFFKRPSTERVKFRHLVEMLVEDYLVIGAVSMEKSQTRGGNFLKLLPVDAGTIKLKIDKSGRTPTPPNTAYEQWISGKKVAELTTNELVYEIRAARTNSPYGLSPLESLIMQVKSALAGAEYNFTYFSDSNVPEGIMTVPEDWDNDQIKEFQDYFDAMLAGNTKMQRRIKFMPPGDYVQTKKPEDMKFEKFEMWLLQQTCAVFGVQPQDIGFTHDVNKATGEVQAEKGQERGKRPIASFIQDVFTDILQEDLGKTGLEFKFLNVDPTDKESEAEIDDIRLKSGVISIDEIRRREGLEELGVGHMVYTSKGPVPIEQIGQESQPNGETQEEPEEEPEEEITDEKAYLIQDELKKWRTCCINDLDSNREEFRDFNANFIDDEIYKEIEGQLRYADSKDAVRKVFDYYTEGDYKRIKKLKQLSNELKKYF